jgi:hypothetical protein
VETPSHDMHEIADAETERAVQKPSPSRERLGEG